jgi:hypothetical protein
VKFSRIDLLVPEAFSPLMTRNCFIVWAFFALLSGAFDGLILLKFMQIKGELPVLRWFQIKAPFVPSFLQYLTSFSSSVRPLHITLLIGFSDFFIFGHVDVAQL